MNKDKDFPDKKLSELTEEERREYNVREPDDAEGDIEQMKAAASIVGALVMLDTLLEEDVITLEEYIRIAEHLEEKNRELPQPF
ncbi:hypothetical protein HAPG_00039 [Halorubrum phage GNf2]|nr:hypothetical protein HAPG_00039 [Halorubrum phage GNf2]